ncbi:DUF1338 domain-containing protein [Alteromonas stellipolaris]|uniref:DUF1338 domain-containing protein n=1 Tax=Alteromonas stellipolaris TaxID=233316 RepID=UPI0026E1FEFC|nr:DUF1338 domain-containing protein [Alteromonas stellipolaris]MDO6535958.1 DUF1338 domain-containing protein [Alteromonas stellipolaris]MDO6627609.1 DUF1338 domain-containing protein [Alteromonas stellipolaris]
MHNNIDTLFANMWDDYVAITPSAHKIHALLADEESTNNIVNDHVAFRTFALDKTALEKLAAHFLALGYTEMGDYNFEAKKLTAKHFEHPDDTKPKVFISELRVNELSDNAQAIIQKLVAQMDADVVTADNFLYSGRHWDISKADYDALLDESEYAAWLAAWGFCANHFTVSVNHLGQTDELSDVNARLKDAGFVLNTSGGEIKGGPEVFLAQSSTMADRAPVNFSDETAAIPSCFYEFAQRYDMPNGKRYQGFVAASADKIFESTNAS